MKFILAIDQGTTGTTSLLLNSESLKVVDKVKQDYRQIYPNPGWVEHNLEDIWTSVKDSVQTLMIRNKVDPSAIEAIGITNQRETTCAYTKSGEPLHHAIVWQDRRTHEFCQKNSTEYNSKFKSNTGLPLDPYFSATKMRWLLDNSEKVKSALNKNNLLLSTIDSFLLYRLTNGTSFCTEPSNASRTMLMNLNTFNWDKSLLDFFGIDLKCLPEIRESFGVFGKTSNCDFLPDGIPILSILGDQQAALFGQACVEEGDLKCTYGTGAFLLLNTGKKITYSTKGLLTTAAYFYKGEKVYALEGSAYIAGAAVQWLRDNLKCIKQSSEVENLAKEVTDLSKVENVLFMPFFTGIGTPYWNSEAKAAIIGLTRDTHNGHIARACLEGITLSVDDSVSSFKSDFSKLNDIKVDGGASANDLLMQLQANFSQKEILRPSCIDTTALGVAFGCLVAQEKIRINDLKKFWSLDKKFTPESNSYYGKKKLLWSETIKKLFC
jgi:glycerol kinase